MIRILVGDCLQRLKDVQSRAVQLCVTSPPYYGLRDYNVPGQLGLEPTPEEYIDNLVKVFRETRRTLRDDGCLVLNLGDSYASSGKAGPVSDKSTWHGGGNYDKLQFGRAPTPPGYKPKDLMGIPWRVVLALQADGWYLRSAMPWVKPSAMPESVRDRPTTAHEYIFLLAKSRRYYWDAEAIRKPNAQSTILRDASSPGTHQGVAKGTKYHQEGGPKILEAGAGRNFRTSDIFNTSLDLTIEQQRAYLAHLEHIRDNNGLLLDEDGDPVALIANTASFKGAHFATFPTELVEPFVKAGTSEKGACPECGAGWVRVVERDACQPQRRGGVKTNTPIMHKNDIGAGRAGGFYPNETHITGWRPACPCPPRPSVPQVVLDPFCGAGTTLLVSERHGRNSIGIELNEEYATMARNRVYNDAPLFTKVTVVHF